MVTSIKVHSRSDKNQLTVSQNVNKIKCENQFHTVEMPHAKTKWRAKRNKKKTKKINKTILITILFYLTGKVKPIKTKYTN